MEPSVMAVPLEHLPADGLLVPIFGTRWEVYLLMLVLQ